MADLDDIINGKQDEFENVIDEIEKDILLSAGHGIAPSVVDASRLVDDVFLRAGYTIVLDSIVNTTYNDLFNVGLSEVEKAIGDTVTFSDATVKRLMEQKRLDLNQFDNLVRNVKTKLSAEIFKYSDGSMSKKQFRAAIADIRDQFQSWTNTWVDTSIAGYKREAFKLTALDAGVEKFRYVGPRDKKTRPFCDEALSKEPMSFAEWDKLDNGQIGPVSIYGGGYNCRHGFVVVT